MPVRNCIACQSRNSTTCQIREHLPTIRRQLPASGSYSHEVSSNTFTAQATSNAAASTVCTPSIPVLNNAFMAGKASCDSSSGVSSLIFPVIQDSFTFDSGLPTGGPRERTLQATKKAILEGWPFPLAKSPTNRLSVSVLRDFRATPAEPIVQTGFHGMLVVAEAGADDIGRTCRKGGVAEIVVLILNLG
jgi:hypothetical protein